MVFSISAKLILYLRGNDFDDPAFDHMGRIAFDQPVDHTGTADEPDLPDGQRQQRTLHAVIQLAAGHHLGEAAGAAELLLQLLLVELLTLEYRYLQHLGRKSIPVLRQFCETGDGGGVRCVLLQPQCIGRLHIPALPYTEYRYLLEFFELPIGKSPDGEIIKVIAENAAYILRQTVVGDHVEQQAAVHQVT